MADNIIKLAAERVRNAVIEDGGEIDRAEAMAAVRAVLQANREPSPAMLRAGDIDIPSDSETHWQIALGADQARSCFQAMIDAALQE